MSMRWLTALLSTLVIGLLFGILPPDYRAQNKRGGVEKKQAPAVTETITKPADAPKGRRPHPPGSHRCDSVSFIVSCGVPNCEISLDGEKPKVADGSGESEFRAEAGPHRLKITKAGYDSLEDVKVEPSCQRSGPFKFPLKQQQASIRIRTVPGEADISINASPQGKSDGQGVFSFQTGLPALLIAASKPGYLPVNKTVTVGPNGSNPEIVLALKPLAATISILVNVEDARALIDDQGEYQSLKAKLQLPPGHHRISIEALGYATTILEVDLAPDKTENRRVTLERMSVAQLKEQAGRLYSKRAYKEVLKLCQYIFEVDPGNAAASRLAGLANLAQQNYAKAETYLAKGLAANEVVELPVRRHPREAFDIRKGHDICEAVLILSKTDLEFRGRHYSNDNFKVPYAQLKTLGVLIKSNQAVYLATKVTDEHGKKRDFNFYSHEHELSQSGRAYLEMVQHLLQPH